MANRMMKGFGMGKQVFNQIDSRDSLGDPFKNDPFFSGKGGLFDGFGNMDKMVKQMRSDMQQQMANPAIMQAGKDGKGMGHFKQMQIVSSTKMGKDGKPVRETYKTDAQGSYGGGNKITERHQLYENTANGYKKKAHERMINDKGRKQITEKVG